MKYFIFLAAFMSWGFVSYGQFVEISKEKFDKVELKQQRCLSNDVITDLCPLGVRNFNVNLFGFYFDEQNQQLRIIGRVCRAKEIWTTGIPIVTIFTATITNGTIEKKEIIGNTTEADELTNNAGFFDVTFRVENGMSLCFHFPNYMIKVYKISQFNN